MSDSFPSTFGRYQLLELIAKGGMAEVFKAKLSAAAGAEKLLCIKRILPDLSRNSDFMSLFISEAKIALPLNHGNITQVFDFGEIDGVYYLAMEYINGQNLNLTLERLRDGNKNLDVTAALYVGAEVCKGLQYAHSYTDAAGKMHVVVHRDVTPHNVLISYTGQVKLADFGIALAATKMRDDGVVRGKPCYVSPEQAEGQPTDPRSDIFSLGTVLYEMLTGRRCFEGDGEAEILRKVATASVLPPSTINANISPEIDMVVLKALARDPAERYQRAGDMQVALSRLLHREGSDYTAESLAVSMKDLFAWEQQQGDQGGTSRDRLLMQLSRAGVAIDDTSAGTGELLELGTVAIGSAGSPKAPPKWKKYLPWGGGLAGLAAVVALVFVLASGKSGVDNKPDSGLAGAPPPVTEHLLPSSISGREKTTHAAGTGATTQPATKSKRTPTKVPIRKLARAGFLNCNSWPWSVVYLNGRRLRGNTPIYRVRVVAGRHRLKFVNPELGLAKEVTVSVEADQTKTVAVSLQ